jgi:mannobiose 2-epimerase
METAVTLYHLLEKHAYDSQHGGYFEGFTANWQQRLTDNVDEVDGPIAKTMNTHLHVIEAYTNLLRVWPDAALKTSVRRLLRRHLDHIINQETGHLRLHFAADWQPLNDPLVQQAISYGHDIEASWLLVEAAEVLGDEDMLAEVVPVARHMAQICYDEGLDSTGGLRDAPDNPNKEWWPQAEALVGFLNAYQLSQEPHFLDAVLAVWTYTKEQIIDHDNGEWFWGRQPDGALLNKEKTGLWKTPYHNGRACLELIHRLDKLIAAQGEPHAPLRL